MKSSKKIEKNLIQIIKKVGFDCPPLYLLLFLSADIVFDRLHLITQIQAVMCIYLSLINKTMAREKVLSSLLPS